MRAKIDIATAASSPWAVLADYPKVALPVAGVNLCQFTKPHTSWMGSWRAVSTVRRIRRIEAQEARPLRPLPGCLF
jgi:hypothetical protein